MRRCGFGPNPESSGDSVDNPWPHISVTGRLPPILVSFLPYSRRDNPPPLNSAGRVHCPMESYNNFLRVHVDGVRGLDNTELGLSAQDFNVLHTPYQGLDVQSALYTPGAWNLANLSVDGSQFALFHEGSNGYNRAIARLEPARNASFMTMTNLGGERADRATRDVMSRLSEGSLVP